jgi:uracil-DNA glycosylase family 4
LITLAEEWGSCKKCELHKKRTQVVFGSGNAINPKILIVGEAPGPEEDKVGIPFFGTTGKLLRRTLESVGIDPNTDCYITNSVMCFPTVTGKDFRGPLGNEIVACKPRLMAEFETLRKSIKVILLTGKRPTATFLYDEALQKGTLDNEPSWNLIKLEKLIGWHDIEALAPARVYVTYHPSYISRLGANIASLPFVKWKKDLSRVAEYALSKEKDQT